jgi:multidrug efflux pump
MLAATSSAFDLDWRTVSAAVVISSFVALTLSPMMCSKLLKSSADAGGLPKLLDGVIGRARTAYGDFLRMVLPFSWLSLLLIGAALGWAWVLYSNLDNELVPNEDRGSFFIGFSTSDGASFDHTVEEAMKVEEFLLEMVDRGDVKTALVRVPGFGGRGFNSGIAIVVLEPWNERDVPGQAIVAEANQKLGEIAGIRGFAGMRSSLGGRGGGDDIEFVIAGGDYQALDEAAEAMVQLARTSPHIIRPRKNFEQTSPRTVVSIDRERAAALGVSVRDIGRSLEVQLGGRRVTTYVDQGEEYDVILQTDLEDRRSQQDLSNIFVRGNANQLIPLSSVVTLRETGEASSLPRINRLRAISITATLADGSTLGEAIEWFRENSAQVIGPGMTTEFVGGAADLQEAERALLFAFAMALLICFLVLAAQFESLINPLIIMLTVPLAVAGGLFGLTVGDATLNMYSQIGLVILIGLAAKNGILIVEFANQLRDEGMEVRDALVEASMTRFRPILMTGLSTALGATPLILSSGAGAESREAIGLVIVYGVLIATLFTLVVTPLLYGMLGRFAGSPGMMARKLSAMQEEDKRKKTGGQAAPAE